MPSLSSPQFHTTQAASLYKSFRQVAPKHNPAPTEQTRSPLEEVVFNVSEGCNLACSYCFAGMGTYGSPTSRWMTTNTARKAVRFITRRGVPKVVKLFGGEPFMNMPACSAIVDEFSSLFEQSQIDTTPTYVTVTNMTIWNRRIEAFINNSKVKVTASIDGPKSIHDLHRTYSNGRGSFTTVDRNIHIMQDMTGEPSALECVYTPSHLDAGISPAYLRDYLSNRYHINDIILVPVIPTDTLPSNEGQSWAQTLRQLGEDYSRSIHARTNSGDSNAQLELDSWIQQITIPKRSNYCGMGTSSLTIDAEGHLTPCYTLIGKEGWTQMQDIDNLSPHLPDELQTRVSRINKDNDRVCSECAIRDCCWGCPGAQVNTSGEIDTAYSSSCEFMIGFIEGLMLEFARKD
ncbi:radical SAM/SPASM domain-containing protein [Actinomyces succiniciruminis]|uniref:Radical SAM domain protein n=1 Tax=Actinomyces succiniciruminis TaxID=1522002 RepID=A0A1L7RSW5_9ACTO|nr:radical SAM protein [Actinomyces succiniciruminis]CED92524.1 Radical SAM domain protein [Actinomyces succiniciruminis]